MKKKRSKGWYFFLFLIFLNLILGGVNLAKAKGLLIPEEDAPVVINNTIDLDSLTLRQKIAQMVVVLGVEYYAGAFKSMQVGGIHLHAMVDEDSYKKTIQKFQKEMAVPLFVTVDLEGCVNPFANFKEFPSVNNITSIGAAFEKGKTEGSYLKKLGVTINFAPVVDLEDNIWKCRTFPGKEENVSVLANSYILGLQDEGIIATAKHYPGKTLIIKDPHKYLAAAEIGSEDLYPYLYLINKKTIKAIMVSHLITYGEVNSEGKPSVTSQKIIQKLRKDFDGVIITDEINMLGVKKFYKSTDEMYLEVFLAGSDLVLNFNNDPNEIYHLISVIEDAVKKGKIKEERIDASVKKILELKGLKVK